MTTRGKTKMLTSDAFAAEKATETAPKEARGGNAPLPHVVAWNLTRRCNLRCAHCYISAGPNAETDGELSTDECLRIADEILAINPRPLFILSGGEPLLRKDLAIIARHAVDGGATVTVGTNGTLLDDGRIEGLRTAGVTGVAVSVDSLSPHYHDRFRQGCGAHAATLAAVERLKHHCLDFVVQTTLTRGNRGELSRLAEWSANAGAVAFNAYLIVATGRGERMGALSPEEGEAVLAELVDLHLKYLGKMMVRAKCAPQYMRLVHARAPQSPILNYATRCPCGVQYCRIAPDGKLTACPYLPLPAGDLRRQGFADVWRNAPLFLQIREANVGGKCGRCGYRAMCGGCRARAYAESGDPLGPDPACAYEPRGDEPLVQREGQSWYGDEASPTLRWTPEAEARIARIPSFVRGVVVQRVEALARSRGIKEINADLLGEMRRAMPVDFSKRTPFFARDKQ